ALSVPNAMGGRKPGPADSHPGRKASLNQGSCGYFFFARFFANRFPRRCAAACSFASPHSRAVAGILNVIVSVGDSLSATNFNRILVSLNHTNTLSRRSSDMD